MGKKKSPGAGYLALIIFLALFSQLLHQASPPFTAPQNRIIRPGCERMSCQALTDFYSLGNWVGPICLSTTGVSTIDVEVIEPRKQNHVIQAEMPADIPFD